MFVLGTTLDVMQTHVRSKVLAAASQSTSVGEMKTKVNEALMIEVENSSAFRTLRETNIIPRDFSITNPNRREQFRM